MKRMKKGVDIKKNVVADGAQLMPDKNKNLEKG